MIVQSSGDTIRAARTPGPAHQIWSLQALREVPALARSWREHGYEVAGLFSYEAGMALHGLPLPSPANGPLALLYKLPRRDTQLITLESLPRLQDSADFTLSQAFECDQDDASFLNSIERIKDYLAAGDCYQVNLSRRWSARYAGDPFAAFKALIAAHPAPWASYMPTPQGAVFGVSPERFLSIHERTIKTQPIKGSRPRAKDPARDEEERELLTKSGKDRAENLMIVDLLRNDLGAVAIPGTVEAPELFSLQSFTNVHHLVSTVTATLHPDHCEMSALMSCLPGGSITGAPKRRAMEIISELEQQPRGFYCGTQFWLGDWGLESNILIRTFQAIEGLITCHGGSGIVFDSAPESELAETGFKIRSFLDTLSN